MLRLKGEKDKFTNSFRVSAGGPDMGHHRPVPMNLRRVGFRFISPWEPVGNRSLRPAFSHSVANVRLIASTFPLVVFTTPGKDNQVTRQRMLPCEHRREDRTRTPLR